MRSNRPRIIAATLFVGVAALALAACGGSGTPSAGATPTSSTTKPASSATATLAAYRSCMAKHGVTLPTRPAGAAPAGTGSATPDSGSGSGSGQRGSFRGQLPAGVTQSQMDAARQACASLRPKRSGQGAFNSQAFQAYRSCMADHGVTLPERPANGSSGSSTTPSSSTAPPVTIDRSSPAYQAAAAVCRPLLPQGGSGATGGTGGSGSSTTTSPAGA